MDNHVLNPGLGNHGAHHPMAERIIQKESPGWLLPTVLSTTAGAVDVIGFLALGGLFTAHITGNLVVLLAHYITGNFGEIGPLLAVPIFIVVLGVVTFTFIRKPTSVARRELLVLQLVLLACFLGFGVGFGAFPNPDSGMAVFVGMLGVAAMATQNAVVRFALPGAPSTAVMTTNIVQVTVDLARLLRGKVEDNERRTVRHRSNATLFAVIGFLIGLAVGAVLEMRFGFWSLIFPAILAAASIPLGERWPNRTK
jgi:uncharacterized membrane protein YoaK (UPF0700 family)